MSQLDSADQKPPDELAKAGGFLCSSVHTRYFGLRKRGSGEQVCVDDRADLRMGRSVAHDVARGIGTHLQVRFAPLRRTFESKSVKACCLRCSDVHSVPLGMSSDDDPENRLWRVRDVLEASKVASVRAS